MAALRLAFMGSPEFGLPALAALDDAGHEIVCVYSQPPRPAGRGQKESRAAVHEYALAASWPVRTPPSLKSPDVQADFAALELDAAVVAAYGLILPTPILAAPRLGCLNIHASLLPRWRGASPIQAAILAGDSHTGVTIMQMDAGLDTGAVVLQERVPIAPNDTAQTLHDKLAEAGARLIVPALDGIAAGRIRPQPQPDGATYAPKLTRDDGKLDWTRPADELARRVRALNPWPGTFFEKDGRIRVLEATVAHGTGAPGTVLDDDLTVACGSGALRLTQLQRAGRGALPAAEFLRGFPIPRGAVLS
jgi:methionyl-tRNA formyltransferase